MPSKRILRPGGRATAAVCQACGSEFLYWPSQHKGGPARFCSRPCWWAYLGRGRVNVVCEQCGKTFFPYARSKDSAPRRFCQRECHVDFTRKIGMSWQERFWLEVDKSQQCWLWIGGQRRGYGEFTKTWAENGASTDRQSATHVAWLMATGEEVPNGMMIGHTCDTPLCIRNDDSGTYVSAGQTFRREGHLFLCTAADNMRDMNLKGRNANAKLSPSMVREIRLRSANGDGSTSIFAREYGVTRATIRSLLKGRTWSHISDS